jgi:DNA-binding NtrC family response regulator
LAASIKLRVYVVDDEEIIATTLAITLSKAGFLTTSFTNSLEALLSAETDAPDFLISDVMMPRLNDIDLGVQFKAIYPDCRVLLFSGNAATSDLVWNAVDKGHSLPNLAKPVHPNELLAAIGALGD